LDEAGFCYNKFTAWAAIIAMANRLKLELHQVDIKGAYLNGMLNAVSYPTPNWTRLWPERERAPGSAGWKLLTDIY